jgi:hypothetical protein
MSAMSTAGRLIVAALAAAFLVAAVLIVLGSLAPSVILEPGI